MPLQFHSMELPQRHKDTPFLCGASAYSLLTLLIPVKLAQTQPYNDLVFMDLVRRACIVGATYLNVDMWSSAVCLLLAAIECH